MSWSLTISPTSYPSILFPYYKVLCSHNCLPSLPGTHYDHFCYRGIALAVPSRNILFSRLSHRWFLPSLRCCSNVTSSEKTSNYSFTWPSIIATIIALIIWSYLMWLCQLLNLKAPSPTLPTVPSRCLINLLNEWIFPNAFKVLYCISTNSDKTLDPCYIFMYSKINP